MNTVWQAAYLGLTTFLYGVAWPVLRFLAARTGEAGQPWRERLGYLPAGLPREALYVHAASVGEVTALAPFFRELARQRGRRPIVLSVMTAAGRARARALYPFPVVHPPVEASGPVRRWLDSANPSALFIMETELWPVWLDAAVARCPVVWVNGRISDRSWPKYRWLRPLLSGILSRFSQLCVIAPEDRNRAIALGAPARRVQVMGNLKTDALVPARTPAGLGRGPWLIAGSTRPGEEAIILEAFRRVRERHPRARLCLAPRHLDRVAELERLVRGAGFRVARRTARATDRADILLLDTHGELAAAYRGAAGAFVGGTLVPVGGHNVLEPALAGVAVCFGAYTSNVAGDAAALVKAGGGFVVRDAAALADRWSALLRAPGVAGRRALRCVRARQGVARRVVTVLRRGGWA